MNPLVDDKAPYALALLVTLLGWFLTNAVADADKTLLLSYDVKPFTDGGKDYARVRVTNQSLSMPMQGIDVVLSCPSTPCLTAANPLTRGAYSVSTASAEWLVVVNPRGPLQGPDQDKLSFSPNIPARGEVSILVGKVAGSEDPIVQFGLPASSTRTPEVEHGYSIRGAVFANWFWVLLFGGLTLSILVVLWMGLIQRSRVPGGQP